MATLKTIFRPSSKGDEFEGSICLRIIHKRRVKVITLPYKIYSTEWDNTKRSLIFPNELKDSRNFHLQHINERLHYLYSFLGGIIHSLEIRGTYSLEDIVSEYEL